MSTHQIHFGRKFYQDKQTGYWISTDMPKIRAHQWVWKNIHGLIPKGYHIHHKDENKSNNDINNLILVKPAEHLRLHASEERTAKRREQMHVIRHLTKHWHASKEGHDWHKLHGLKTWVERAPIKIICKICSKEAITKTYHQEFCSNACKSKWRRHQKIDYIEKTCVECKKMFYSSKYSKNITCGRTCGGKYKSNRKKTSS